MSDELIIEKLEKIFNECEKHIKRIEYASNNMMQIMPLNKDKYIQLTDEEVEHIDQFLFRFSKLQDAIGQKLFKSILVYLNEEVEGRPFIDILNLLEKLNLLNSAKTWKELRNDRNELSHNYDDQPEKMSEIINTLYDKKDIFFNIYKNINNYYQKSRI